MPSMPRPHHSLTDDRALSPRSLARQARKAKPDGMRKFNRVKRKEKRGASHTNRHVAFYMINADNLNPRHAVPQGFARVWMFRRRLWGCGAVLRAPSLTSSVGRFASGVRGRNERERIEFWTLINTYHSPEQFFFFADESHFNRLTLRLYAWSIRCERATRFNFFLRDHG
ncbi:hypothetical protein EDB84DRAFT_1464753 [Lactarius hengduanensis]|nr:hypothetical protein EDB84DRAFT_1464753 [Lactarius hengduanensis]